MRVILKDKEHDKILADKGYVVLRNVVAPEIRLRAQSFYNNLGIELKDGFVLANLLTDLELRKRIHEELPKIFGACVNEIFQDVKYVLGTLAIKPPSAKSSFGLHQDWSLVDETRYHSYSMWVPLVDVSELNGCFRVLPGSCETFFHPRGMNIPFPYQDYSTKISEDFMLPLAMKAGDALIFNHQLVHDSKSNATTETRVAAVMALLPAEAPLCHYYRQPGSDTIDLYELREDFLVTNDFTNYSHAPLNSTLVKSIPYRDPEIDYEKFKQLYAASVY